MMKKNYWQLTITGLHVADLTQDQRNQLADMIKRGFCEGEFILEKAQKKIKAKSDERNQFITTACNAYYKNQKTILELRTALEAIKKKQKRKTDEQT
jgi:hypothetical protein